MSLLPEDEGRFGLSLAEDCRKGLRLLQLLTQPQQPHEVSTLEAPNRRISRVLSGDAIVAAKGLLFLVTSKYGLGITVSHGHGMLLAKLGGQKGAYTWSAPCAITVNMFGMGLSVGSDTLCSVIVLTSDDAVLRAQSGQLRLGVDVELLLDLPFVKNYSEGTRASSSSQRGSAVAYTVADGWMVDLSFTFGPVLTSNRINELYYGKGNTAPKVLSGEVLPPPEMAPLYDELNRLSAEAAGVSAAEAAGAGTAAAAAAGTAAASTATQDSAPLANAE